MKRDVLISHNKPIAIIFKDSDPFEDSESLPKIQCFDNVQRPIAIIMTLIEKSQ